MAGHIFRSHLITKTPSVFKMLYKFQGYLTCPTSFDTWDNPVKTKKGVLVPCYREENCEPEHLRPYPYAKG